jgi:hypothetical protein
VRHANVGKHTCITSMSRPHLGSSSRTGTTSGSAGEEQLIRITTIYCQQVASC